MPKSAQRLIASSSGVHAELFSGWDLAMLWLRGGYSSTAALQAASRESLKQLHLTPAQVDLLTKYNGAEFSDPADAQIFTTN